MVLQSNTSFGATPTPGEHFGVSCDECKAAICGIRHKCNFCPNYDLCSQCRQRGIHSHHMMHELQPYPHQSNFPQPPTPYPQYPHPTSPPNQYNNPSCPQYPQGPGQYPQIPGQYPQAPGQYPYPPQTFNPNASNPYPAYPQYPSQGGQTPLPSSNPMPTQYPFSPSPYPCQNPSSTFTSHTYPQYPSQYPHDQTSSPIQASHSSQQPPIDSVTAAQHQTQIQNSTPIQATVSTQSTASVQSAQTTTQTQGATTHAPPVVQGQTTGPGSFDNRSPFPVHGIRGFPPPGRNRRRHPPSTQTHQPIPGQLLSSVLDLRGKWTNGNRQPDNFYGAIISHQMMSSKNRTLPTKNAFGYSCLYFQAAAAANLFCSLLLPLLLLVL